MSSKKRRVTPGVVQHIYIRAKNGFVIYYDAADRLVFYTIFSMMAQRYGIEVIGICLMPTHIHALVAAESQMILSRFMSACLSIFAKEYNRTMSLKGSLFQGPYGSAQKYGSKKIRTAISYLYNNPTEKQLTTKAEKYRWNFLAFAQCKNPFSQYLPLRKSSWRYRCALKELKSINKRKLYLKYSTLRNLFKKLYAEEKQRLIDAIITIYNPINYRLLTEFYGDYSSMLLAINSNTGSEYDIKEEDTRSSDRIYSTLNQTIKTLYPDSRLKGFLSLEEETKNLLAQQIRRITNAGLLKIKLFLHLKE